MAETSIPAGSLHLDPYPEPWRPRPTKPLSIEAGIVTKSNVLSRAPFIHIRNAIVYFQALF